MTTKIYLELCRRHLNGCTIVETWTTSAEDAAKQLREKRPNGLFVRISPPDEFSPEDQERYAQNCHEVAQ